MGISFESSLRNFKSDGIIDKQEIEKLKQVANQVKEANPESNDAKIADYVMYNLEAQDETVRLKLPKGESGASFDLDIIVTPDYSEKDKIEGSTIDEVIGKISQSDDLKSTKSDMYRCVACTMLDMALRDTARKNTDKSPEEVFAIVAKKLGVGTDLTYENFHKAQDKLYNIGNVNKGSSKNETDPNHFIDISSYKWKGDDKEITSAKAAKEISLIAKKLGLDISLMSTATSVDNLSEGRKPAIQEYFKNNPNGSLLVGAVINEDNKISPATSLEDQNHAVEIYMKDGEYYLKDTGGATNGEDNVIKLSAKDVEKWLYNNSGDIIQTN